MALEKSELPPKMSEGSTLHMYTPLSLNFSWETVSVLLTASGTLSWLVDSTVSVVIWRLDVGKTKEKLCSQTIFGVGKPLATHVNIIVSCSAISFVLWNSLNSSGSTVCRKKKNTQNIYVRIRFQHQINLPSSSLVHVSYLRMVLPNALELS